MSIAYNSNLYDLVYADALFCLSAVTMASLSPIFMIAITIIGLLLLVSGSNPEENKDRELIIDEEEALAWLDYLNSELEIRGSRGVELNFNYQTNITDYNQQKFVSVYMT